MCKVSHSMRGKLENGFDTFCRYYFIELKVMLLAAKLSNSLLITAIKFLFLVPSVKSAIIKMIYE